MRNHAAPLVLLLTCLLFSQTVSGQLEEQVDVGLMEVWVKVTDRQDQPVRDLSIQEFEIFIDGQKMDVRCFDRVTAGFTQPAKTNEDSASEVKRRFVFFFDLLNSNPGDIHYFKQQLLQFLDTSFQDDDEAMVFALLPNMHLGVVQKMTSDRFALKNVVLKMQGNFTLAAALRNNERQLLDLLNPFDTTTEAHPGAERGVGVRPMDTFRLARALARNMATAEEQRSRFTLRAFEGVAGYIASSQLNGRLVMLYVSSGFPLQPGQHYFDLVERALERRTINGLEEMPLADRPAHHFENDLKKTIGQLNRLNVTIYSVDAKGLLGVDRSADRNTSQALGGINSLTYNYSLQDSLVFIARETGGLVFNNSQNYRRGLEAIARDISEQYWLCSTLPPQSRPGVYHAIEVKVKRSGVNVRHRKGYVE